MIRAQQFAQSTMIPALAWLRSYGGPEYTLLAARQLLAIGLQESGFTSRCQLPDGPAHGFWQFEEGGAKAVLQHAVTGPIMTRLCNAVYVTPTADAVWRALEGHDVFAAAVARLLLFADPHPLPTTQDEGWDCYKRAWQPGKPWPSAWPSNWAIAQSVMFPTTQV